MTSRTLLASLALLACGCMAVNQAFAQESSQQTRREVRKPAIETNQSTTRTLDGKIREVRAPFKPKVVGIDPAVIALRADVKRRISANTAEIEIVGVVQNIGTKDFLSSANQQSVQLYSKTPGAKDRMIAQTKFVNLASGKKVEVKHRLQWSTSVEFPSDYLVLISYDPDISIDGNADNDDVRSQDNRRELKGDDITRKVRKTLASGGPRPTGKAAKK